MNKKYYHTHYLHCKIFIHLQYSQENRFKTYKQHLEYLLKDYSTVCSMVPEPLQKLLLPHMESVIQYLQPGLSTLAWNSMNIDAYLHQVHLANGRLRSVVENINKVCCVQRILLTY